MMIAMLQNMTTYSRAEGTLTLLIEGDAPIESLSECEELG